MSRFQLFKGGDGASRLRPKSKISFLAAIIFAAFIGVYIIFVSFTTYVRPYEVAIKESRYGGGLDEKPRPGPGLFFTGPGVTYHRFPTVVQTLTMNSSLAESSQGGKDTRSIKSLEIDSSDGSKIRIDATVLYRISDPYQVMTRAGPGRLFEDNAIIPKSAQALKESLGRLRAEDFYNEVLRIKATDEAKARLNESVSAFGLSVDHVLIRQYYYMEAYQQQIEERKVQDQLVFTNAAMAEAAKMEANTRKLDSEGQAAVNIERQRGDAEVTKIRAEADLYARKRRAEADLLVSLAEAEGTEQENAAYRLTAGSDNLVGLDMAEILKGVDIIFLQSGKDGVNVLDVNQTLRMFDVKGN